MSNHYNIFRAIISSLIISLPLLILLPSGILGFILSGSTNIYELLSCLILIFIIDSAANIINNHSDWDGDVINKKRHHVHTHITKNTLLFLYIIFILLSIMLLVIFKTNIYVYELVIIFTLIGLIYSLGLKIKDVFILNYIFIGIAYAAIPFSIGYFFGSNSFAEFLKIIPILLFLSITTFTYTITKDYPDIAGDKLHKKLTLPVIFGKNKSVTLQTFMVIVSYLLLLLFISIGLVDLKYIISILSMFIEIIILNKIKLTENDKKLKNMAFYNKINHFILRLILIIISLF